MKVTVNEQEQVFYLATENGWEGAVGHGLTIGKCQLCIIPKEDALNISEVTSGLGMIEIPYSYFKSIDQAIDRKGAMKFFKDVGERTRKALSNIKNLDSIIEEGAKRSFERHGAKPNTKNVNLESLEVNYDN